MRYFWIRIFGISGLLGVLDGCVFYWFVFWKPFYLVDGGAKVRNSGIVFDFF
jgi:hypothetical protein